ncbi:MAG: sigma-70 family RNA polymerase sigma factor [Verrucomicrobia bacterium]|nr:sigma-70 family RNA polymerase sigma factor [Verrucomicrobiota bacterium]
MESQEKTNGSPGSRADASAERTLSRLVEAVCAGDQTAFEQLVRRFQNMAYGYAFSIVGDFHLAQDVAQEAFVEAYRQLPHLRTPKAFPGWFRRIVFKYSDRLTRRKHVDTVPLTAVTETPSDTPAPDDVAEERDMKDAVLKAIGTLPSNERAVITLYYMNGYTQKNVAEFLELSVNTVNNRLHAARKRLKQRMVHMLNEELQSVPLPADFADMVVRAAVSDADLETAAGLLSYSSRTRPENFRSANDAKRAGIYVVDEDGSVRGAGYFNETTLSVGMTVLRAVRPAEMGAEAEGVPHPAFVKGFEGCFKLARERGIHVAVAHGSQFDHGFCGMVPCFYYPVATLPCEIATGLRTSATIRKATSEEEGAARQAWATDPYVPKLSAYIGGGVTHVVEEEDAIVGYVRVNPDFVPSEHCGMPFGHVTDLTVSTRGAALAVLRLVGELSEKAGDDKLWLMQSHKTLVTRTLLNLGGTYRLRSSCDVAGLDAEMVGIIDLAGLTADLADELQSRLRWSLAPHAPAAFSLQMGNETASFAVEDGRLAVGATKQNVHLPLPRWLLTRLYMGYYSGEDLLAMGPIPCDRSDGMTPDCPALDMQSLSLPEPEADLFAALFPKLWPCSWPDPDVWPWVIGEAHPHYQGEDRKTPEMKAKINALRFPWLGY